MLKSCWECLAGESPGQEDTYRANHMGGSIAPQWKPASIIHGKMFLVPTQLKQGDEIVITGRITEGVLNVALLPETSGYSSDVVCQLNAVYPVVEAHDALEIRTVRNGNVQDYGQGKPASGYFSDTSFHIRFALEPVELSLSLSGSYVESIPLQHAYEEIRAISVKGDVKEMNFTFS